MPIHFVHFPEYASTSFRGQQQVCEPLARISISTDVVDGRDTD